MLLFHGPDTLPPMLHFKVPGGMRTGAEMFWDEQRELTRLREEREQWEEEHRVSVENRRGE